MKIDIDGVEEKVLAGASKTLEDKRLRSILIELPVRSDATDRVVAQLKLKGFSFKQQAKRDQEGITNFIFVR